jgi:biofilm protein TabA
MRKFAYTQSQEKIQKVMIYDCGEGVYLFLYQTKEDGGSCADYFYETVEEAERVAREEFGVEEGSWISITDPMKDCQHDFIRPVRVKGRNTGNPVFGELEELKDGEWVALINPI